MTKQASGLERQVKQLNTERSERLRAYPFLKAENNRLRVALERIIWLYDDDSSNGGGVDAAMEHARSVLAGRASS